MAKKPRIIDVLGREVDENVLKASLRDVLKRRGLTTHLIVEDKKALEKRLAESRRTEPIYGNIYKYAFF